MFSTACIAFGTFVWGIFLGRYSVQRKTRMPVFSVEGSVVTAVWRGTTYFAITHTPDELVPWYQWARLDNRYAWIEQRGHLERMHRLHLAREADTRKLLAEYTA
jgi:hypothetical protein